MYDNKATSFVLRRFDQRVSIYHKESYELELDPAQVEDFHATLSMTV